MPSYRLNSLASSQPALHVLHIPGLVLALELGLESNLLINGVNGMMYRVMDL